MDMAEKIMEEARTLSEDGQLATLVFIEAWRNANQTQSDLLFYSPENMAALRRAISNVDNGRVVVKSPAELGLDV